MMCVRPNTCGELGIMAAMFISSIVVHFFDCCKLSKSYSNLVSHLGTVFVIRAVGRAWRGTRVGVSDGAGQREHCEAVLNAALLST